MYWARKAALGRSFCWRRIHNTDLSDRLLAVGCKLFQMLRKPVAFLAAAPTIREYEIVARVYRIPSPRDEVIDVGSRWRKDIE
jgi:hypothetical protein